MDFHSNNGDDANSISDMWHWQREEEFCLSGDSQLGLPQCLWDDSNEKCESLQHTMGNQTPLRDFGHFDLDILDLGDEGEKDVDEALGAPRVKRRRVLHFTSDDDGGTANKEHLSAGVQQDSASVKVWTENLQPNPASSDDRFLFSNEVLDPSTDEWLDNYFNDSEMSSNMNDQVKLNSQIDVSDFLDGEPDKRTKLLPNHSKSATLKIFKGRKSHINSLTKLTTSVAYPFTLVKPSEVQGHLTLKDLNQRILAPPPSRPRNEMVDDPSINYPTSAFSGKPVVVKTKILTEGGKGSITILRTKG
ncbi:protein XRI1-like isoform X1 [Zingiber officinale]|uniref:protein XRI1-like isoform X1 n=1 Tax=Zingiber officinale TaxID=94328 RepID=UPI001C4C4A09|nr:protein XRI1-like isoform X1 [Zingiber officinale]